MAELKTKPNEADVQAFIESINEVQKKEDCYKLIRIMEELTGKPAKMWGKSIVGFDTYHYVYASGKSGDWMLTGFSPRKASLTIYITAGLEHFEAQLSKIGKHKTGKSCLYAKKLEDLDLSILKEIIVKSNRMMKQRYPSPS
jgi:hypothetical protein